MSDFLNVPEIFGSDVFNEVTMKERLADAVYQTWRSCKRNGTPLPLAEANEIAEAMKQWAIEKGATHFTHWFQPKTGITAGEMEVKAWTYRKGWKAPQCAGVIHTDFEKGFIRAEVIKYEDYIKYGSESAVKEAGKMGVEGKEYVVQDGDIMHFRFNV